MGWCKLWDSVLDDEELKDATLAQSGAFVRALALANKCRRAGKFVLPDMTGCVGDRPLKRDEIIKGARITDETFEWLSKKFWEYKEDCWGWKGWKKYQGDAERVHRVRTDVRTKSSP